MSGALDLQHLNVKLILDPAQGLDLQPLIPIFHRWIQEQSNGELLLDIADYRHVPAGPGVILIGHTANYSVDNTGGRLGVRYNRKAPLDGSNQQRLVQAARAALTTCLHLEAESSLAGKLRFGGREIELFINDRLLAPNNDATREAAKPDVEVFCRQLFHGAAYSMAYGADRRELFAISLKSPQPIPAAQLLANLE